MPTPEYPIVVFQPHSHFNALSSCQLIFWCNPRDPASRDNRTFLVLRQAKEAVPAVNKHHIIFQILPLYLELLHDHDVRLQDVEHGVESAVGIPWRVGERVSDAVDIPRRQAKRHLALLPRLPLLIKGRWKSLYMKSRRSKSESARWTPHVVNLALSTQAEAPQHHKNSSAHSNRRNSAFTRQRAFAVTSSALVAASYSEKQYSVSSLVTGLSGGSAQSKSKELQHHLTPSRQPALPPATTLSTHLNCKDRRHVVHPPRSPGRAPRSHLRFSHYWTALRVSIDWHCGQCLQSGESGREASRC
jgi:hypothetical protein